jgi:N-acetylmuramic acid 6-phosphate etherase
MTDMLPPPATEAVSPRYRDLDAWEPETILEALWEGQLAAVSAVKPALAAIAAPAEAARQRLERGGKLVYVGAGTSGRLAVQDGAELHPTFDWPLDRVVLLLAGGDAAFVRAIENAEDDGEAARRELGRCGVGSQDVLLGVAASGTTPFTLTAVKEARRLGALTIAVANSPGAPLLAAAQHPILVETGAEAVAGSTRMKAGTAQKVVLNLFSTLVMVRLGRIHCGLMVDLKAGNEKLRRRSERIIEKLTGRSGEPVQTALAEASGRVKVALLILEGLLPAEAEALLERHHGRLRPALAELDRADA